MLLGMFLLFSWLGFLYKIHVITWYMDNRSNEVTMENIKMLNRLENNSLKTIYNIQNFVSNSVTLWKAQIGFKDRYIVYWAKIVPERTDPTKNALYIKKIIWGGTIWWLETNSLGKLFILTPVKDNNVCKEWYTVNITKIRTIFNKIHSAWIDPFTLKDKDWNQKTVDEVKTEAGLTDDERDILEVISDRNCRLGNSSNSISLYTYINDKTLKQIWAKTVNTISWALIDVVNDNTDDVVGYIIPKLNVSDN